MSLIEFERAAGVLETVRGTAVSPPDHNLGLVGVLDPKQVYVSNDQQYGQLADSTDDDVLTEESADWTADGRVNTALLPFLLNLAVKGGVSAPVANNKVAASVGSLVGGTGYVPANGTFTPIVTGGSPITPASFLATVASGVITNVAVVNPGLGYASAPTLDFTGHTGTGASATVTLATPASAKLWQFQQTETADDLSAMTGYFMDPNTQIFQSAFAMLSDLGFTGDANASNGLVLVKAKGFALFPTKVSTPSYPAAATAYALIPKGLQLWVDAASGNFGDTAVTGRVVSAGVDIPTGAKPVFLANGPGSYGFTRVGRSKMHKTLHLVFEFLDTAQYDQAVANGSVRGGTRLKVRARWNGPAIETVSGVTFYHFLQVDILGQFKANKWGAVAGVNRTLALEVDSSYLSAAGTSFSAYVQCLKTAV